MQLANGKSLSFTCPWAHRRSSGCVDEVEVADALRLQLSMYPAD